MDRFISLWANYGFNVWERLNRYSVEFEKMWDELTNVALVKYMDYIEAVHKLRR